MIDIKRILVPTDFSEPGRKALQYAVEFADRYGAAVDLMHVVEAIPAGAMMSYQPLEELRTSMRTAAEDELEKLHSVWSEYSFPVNKVVIDGHPFVEIVRHARQNDVDLIIMGTHGRGAIAHMLLGSVTEKTIRKAPCPVLTVRHPEHEFIHP